MSAKVEAEVEAFKRKLLQERMEQLTEPQRTMFTKRVFPKGVPSDCLIGAIDLCDRTIKKNEQGRPGPPEPT